MAVPRRLALIVALLLLGLAGSARAQPPPIPVQEAPITVDGPSASIQGLSGLAVSRDGTGGLVYLKSVGGVNHVFVSELDGGEFGPPIEVDAGFSTASSQPVIAAGDGGLLVIAFINGGDLVVVTRPDSSSPLSGPADLYNGALNPSIAMSIHSEGYLAFTAVDGSGYDVRDYYYDVGQWQLETGPLNVTPADDAGTGAGAPKVAAAGDGEGIVAWGENGHVYTRRVWAAMTSYLVEQADVPTMNGLSEASSDSPAIATQDDSSYGNVAFRETFTSGSQTISHVFVRRLVGSTLQGVYQADGQAFASGPGASAPGVTMMQFGYGFATSELQGSNNVWATVLGQNGVAKSNQQIDSLGSASPPDPTSTIAGDYAGLIAWQHDPGGLLPNPDIRARYYTTASGFGPELVMSNPGLGPTNAAGGLFAGGDHAGDVAIAYVQGTGAGTTIQVADLVNPPGSFGPFVRPHFRTTARPVLTWSVPHELWGPLTYTVTIDGSAAGTTSTNSFLPPAPLGQGPHTFGVTATNVFGLTSTAATGTLFVDTIRPLAQFTLSGAERVGALLHLHVRNSDTPLGLPRGDASGVANVTVTWGDGSVQRVGRPTVAHRYLRARRYLLKVTITDRAGNRTVLARRIRIAGT